MAHHQGQVIKLPHIYTYRYRYGQRTQSKYTPHQGAEEILRRHKKLAKGML